LTVLPPRHASMFTEVSDERLHTGVRLRNKMKDYIPKLDTRKTSDLPALLYGDPLSHAQVSRQAHTHVKCCQNGKLNS
jgi:hypothetical protein